MSTETKQTIQSDLKRKPLVLTGEIITAPVGSGVEDTLRKWSIAHLDDLTERLRPLGITPKDILMPEWRRVVYQDEVETAK